MIEQGRKTKSKKPRKERIYVLCDDGTNSKIEDEVHFLFDCPWRKYVSQRERLICETEKVVPFYKNIESHNKFLFSSWIIYEWMGNSTRQRFEIRLWKILIG